MRARVEKRSVLGWNKSFNINCGILFKGLVQIILIINYANDTGAGGIFNGIRQHLDDLVVKVTLQGYFPEPTKSILVVSTRNIPRVEAFFLGYSLKVGTGSRYLGCFVEADLAQAQWLDEKV